MIEIKIPKEVTKYEAKLVGPFTVRQSMVLLIVVPIISLIYVNLSKELNSTVCLYLCIPIGGIGALFGWVKPYGLPFEKYLKSVFINSILAPSVRLYKTENYYDLVSKRAKTLEPEDLFVIDALLENMPEEEIKRNLNEFKKNKRKSKGKQRGVRNAIFKKRKEKSKKAKGYI